MMNAKTYTILGCVFILVSGLIFTLERLRVAIVFVGENVSQGSFRASPLSPSIADNLVSIIFLAISIVFFYKAKSGEKR
ncbi:hypothetical protein [Bacillus salipaludis]|uniref:Uncharacterized protein n=1 Tax=Bacillus salipaludis TaxID=2547811 RepID=A0ABW8RNT1_9BACI